MIFNAEANRRIKEAVHHIEQLPKPQPVAQPPRQFAPPRNAVTTSAISARNGLQKGSGTVNILCDAGDGSGKDRVLMTNVKVWNPYSNSVASGTYVTLTVTDGLLQLSNASCPTSS